MLTDRFAETGRRHWGRFGGVCPGRGRGACPRRGGHPGAGREM